MHTLSPASVQTLVNQIISVLSADNESQLCALLGVTQGAISKWKARGKIPERVLQKVVEIITQRISAADVASSVHVSTKEVADAFNVGESSWIYRIRKDKPHLYSLVEDGIRLQKLSNAAYCLKQAQKLSLETKGGGSSPK